MRDTPQERATFAKKKAAAVGGLSCFDVRLLRRAVNLRLVFKRQRVPIASFEHDA
jgi:hypothetical protein